MKPARKSARKPARRRTTARKFASHEYVRVVPLHHPKSVLSIAEARAPAPGDLFSGRPLAAPIDAKLTYRRGPLLTRVKVYTVFWGTNWAKAASAKPLIAGINQFFKDILVSSQMQQLAEYNVPGKQIGRGTFIGTKVITLAAPKASVTDSVIARRLRQWIAARTVPKPDANTLYFIYLDPGVVSIMGGSRSCQSYCGYHSNTGPIYYAVMPYPGCSGCLGGMPVLDALTGTSSHELCEAITDPVPGSGWYDDRYGEIGDICAWNFKRIEGHAVQLEWSNSAGRCI